MTFFNPQKHDTSIYRYRLCKKNRILTYIEYISKGNSNRKVNKNITHTIRKY